MEKLFATESMGARDRYRAWLEFSDERFMPMVHTRTDQDAFDASAQGILIGDLAITRASFSALTLEATAQTVRHPLNKPDVLGFSIKFSGKCIVSQFDRTTTQDDGDISIVDANEPFKFVHLDKTDHLTVQLPREKLESELGPARNFAAINMKGSVTAVLVKSFFYDLLRVQSQLSPDIAARTSKIGADLMVASFAECMAKETPKELRGTVAVQRAKAYIESNLHDPDVDPAQVAAAVGVSLRQLQILFDERGQHIAELIWQRRLHTAAKRLSDPRLRHLPLGVIAYGCGFVNQAHFSRRFKHHFDISPSDYRLRADAASLGQTDAP